VIFSPARPVPDRPGRWLSTRRRQLIRSDRDRQQVARSEGASSRGIVGYHLLALLALVPWFFTWSGVVLALAGLFVFGTLGINLGWLRRVR
jgi:hypothetical protein